VTLWTVARQASLSVGFSRQECWSELPFPSPGDLPNPGIEPRSPALQADSLPSELQERSPHSRLPHSPGLRQTLTTACQPVQREAGPADRAAVSSSPVTTWVEGREGWHPAPEACLLPFPTFPLKSGTLHSYLKAAFEEKSIKYKLKFCAHSIQLFAHLANTPRLPGRYEWCRIRMQ